MYRLFLLLFIMAWLHVYNVLGKLFRKVDELPVDYSYVALYMSGNVGSFYAFAFQYLHVYINNGD